MPATTGHATRLKRPKEPPEDALHLRLVVAAMVQVALVAVIAQGATDALTALAALVLAPLGYWFSYRQRERANITTKVILAVALLAALGAFLQAVRYAETVDEARAPLASLFVWVQVLHAFDVPRRRDLAFSAVSSLILIAEAGALSFSRGFFLFLVPWSVLAGAWLYLSARPRGDELTATTFVRLTPATPGLGRGPAAGRTVMATATCVVVVVGAIFLATPRLPGGFVAMPPFRVHSPIAVPAFDGGVVNPALASAPTSSDGVVGFSQLAYPGFGTSVDLRARGRLSDRIVMQVRANQPALWRGQAYDTFDGTRWTASDSATERVGQEFDQGFDVPPPPEGAASVPTQHVLQTFYVRAAQPNIVFSAFEPERVFFPAANLEVDSSSSIRSPILLEDGLVYSVVSNIPITTPGILRASPAAWSDATLARYTQLPPDLPRRVVALAERIIRGASTTYDEVEAVQAWLRANTSYNLDIPADPPGVDAVDHFLFERRQGFCEHIASAMVVLLRAVGIPARFVTGFGPGERDPFTGYFAVRDSDAHAWVEVLYADVAWVPYDPTFGVPPAAPGIGARFIAPEVLRAIGRFVVAALPAPVRDAGKAVAGWIAAGARAAFGAWWLVLVAVTVAGLAAVLARRRRRRRTGRQLAGASAAFARMVEALGRRGHDRKEHQTPGEYLREVGGWLAGDEVADAEIVVRTFERDRFSGELPGEAEVSRALAAAERIGARRGSSRSML